MVNNMEYPTAMTFEIYTPFILPEELFKGFSVNRESISYIRNGLGILMESYKMIPKRLTMYNDCLNNITPKVIVKALSIKPICVYSNDFVEHIDFEVIVNRYSITPTESLTYELFYDFVKNINERLAQIKDHPLKDFFVRMGTESTFHVYGFQITSDTFITLPDVYIPVTDIDIDEKYILEIIRYMDALKEYYYKLHNEPIKTGDHKLSWGTWNNQCPGWGTMINKSTTDQCFTFPGWEDDSEKEIA
jgi:hypothetical protein